jgi:transposase
LSGVWTLSTSGKDWVLTRPRDLPCGGEFALVQWRKRRWRCRAIGCARQMFTEQVAQVPAGMRTTTRQRTALAAPVEDGRDQSEVAAAHRVWWPTVQQAVVARGASSWSSPNRSRCRAWARPGSGGPGGCPTAPMTAPARMAGSDGGGPIRGRPGSSTSPEQALLGQVDGRTNAAVQTWLAARTEEFRAGVEVVVIDPHAGYAPPSARRCPMRPSRSTTST